MPKMTLLEWDNQGRDGKFVFDLCTLTYSSAHYHLAVEVIENAPYYLHFLYLKELCRYLGHGPSEIEGEVRP